MKMKKIFRMATLMKKLMVVAALAVTAYTIQAFSLLGPWAEWQTSDIGYQLETITVGGQPFTSRDPGGPMGLREGYRFNLPVVTYAFDKTFMEAYGEEGIAEIERAFETINRTFAEMYSSEDYLESVPTQVTRYNYRAMSLGLLDLYSMALSDLTESLGLASPERFCWTLRSVVVSGQTEDPNGNVVPDQYFTIRRNYDPLTLETTPYVNGTLYSYRIIPGIIVDDSGALTHDAMEIVSDPPRFLTTRWPELSGNKIQGILLPVFISRAHAMTWAVLLALQSQQNFALSMSSGANNSASPWLPGFDDPIIVTNIDLAQFLIDVEMTTNTQAEVEALYPGLNITGRTWTNVLVNRTNYIYTNSPWMPAGTPPMLTPVVTKNIQMLYSYTYDNVYTNYGGTVTEDMIRLITVSSGPQTGNPWMPAGMTGVVTNTVEIRTNRVTGGIMIMAGASTGGEGGTNQTEIDIEGELAGYKFIYTNPYPLRVAVTNLIASTGGTPTGDTNATEIPGDIIDPGEDDGTGTNIVTSFTQYMASSHDVYEYLAYPITWSSTAGEGDTNTGIVLYRPGLGSNFRFQRVNFDGLVGNTYTPTNMVFSNIFYMDMSSTTNPYAQLDTTVIRRQINLPDIVFSAADLGAGTDMMLAYNEWLNHSEDNRAGTSGELTGPGVILPGGQEYAYNTMIDYWVNIYENPSTEHEDGRYNLGPAFTARERPVISTVAQTHASGWKNS